MEELLLDNRILKIGFGYRQSASLVAKEHSFTGVMARGSGIPYDCGKFIIRKL